MSTSIENAREAILAYCRYTKLPVNGKLLSFQVREVALKLEPPERDALNDAIRQMVGEGLFVAVQGELGIDLELTPLGSAAVYSAHSAQ